MNNRNSELIERYEGVVFDLEKPIVTNLGNNVYQNKVNYRFVADNIGEVNPFD